MEIRDGRIGFIQTLNNEDFKRKLQDSMREVNSFSAKSVANIEAINVSVKDLAAGLGIAFGINEAKNFIQELVKVRGEFQQTEIAFKTMLGSQEKSTKLMAEMVELAKNTPMQFSEVSQGAKQLLAYQVEAENLTETLTMLGNISSGLGVPLSRLILVYGQVRAKGRLMGDDLRQFTEAGVPMIAEIAKNMGIAQSEVAQLVSDGKVGFKEVEKVLQNLTSQGGLFFNMMEEQSKTIPGQIAKLQDELEQMFNTLGKEAEPAITSLISGVSTVIENYKEIGSAIIDLVAIYGSYKVAVMTVSAIESARAKTIASQISNLGIADKMALGRTAVLARQAEQNLALAKTELINQQAILSTMRAEVSSLAVKKQKATVLAIEKTQLIQNAQYQLWLAKAELNSIQATGTARQVSIAQKNVEKMQNQVIAVQEQAEIARKNALSQSQAFYNAQQNLENQAKKTKIAQGVVSNAQDKVEVTTKNLNSLATARLTLMQNIQLLKTKALTTAQSLLNATMLSNPIVLITATILAMVYAYNKLATGMNSVEKAQKVLSDLNLEAEKNIVKEKLALEELLETAKDDKKSKEDRQKAISELNKISPEYLGQLNLENINTQQATKATNAYTESLFKNAKAMAYRSKLEELYKQEIEQQNEMKNGPKRNIFEKGGDVFWGLIGLDIEEIKNETDVARAVVKAFGEDIKKDKARFNAEYQKALKFYGFTDLLDTKHQIQTIKKEIEKDSLDAKNTVNEVVENSFSGRTIKNKAYWEEQKKIASDARDALGGSEKGSKQWNDLTQKINEAENALEAWNTTKKKEPKPKKSDDPLEIFKKQISEYKDQYDKLQKYSETKNIGLLAESARIKIHIKNKGETYLEFLRNQQKQLIESANTSELAAKKLSVINSELYSLLNDSLIEDFKTSFDKQLDNADFLIDKMKLIADEKEKLEGKTDDESVIKLKFLTEKETENSSNIQDKLNNDIKAFEEQYQYLEFKRKEYDAEMLLLQDQYNKASNDSEKRRIQDLMAIRSAQYFQDTNGKTNNVEVNQIIEEFKNLEQKKADIEKSFNDKKAQIQSQITAETTAEDLKLFTAIIAEIERKQIEALKSVDSEMLKSSEKWVAIFADYSNKSVGEISNLVKEIESVLENPPENLTATEIKELQDRLIELKKVLKRDDPFTQLGDSVEKLSKKFKLANGDINFEGINEVIANAKAALNEAVSMAEGLGIGVSDATKDAIQLGTELFEAGSNIAEGIASKNPMQVVKGVVQGITSIINAGDRKKERQIQKYKAAVDALTLSFKQLQYAANNALGSDTYSMQKQMIDNLSKQQNEIRKMIDAEQRKKKTDKGKIKDWEQQLVDIAQQQQDILNNIVENVLQTNAKDLASTLGDALVEAFSQGEDAAKSFEKVVDDVMKKAVLNQLKTQFLDKQVKSALDQLYKDMGGNPDGSFNWNGLSKEEQEKFKQKMKEISENFSGMLEGYSDLFKDLSVTDPNENSLSGAIKGVSEETANLIAGQMNAIRILQVEALEAYKKSSLILVQQLDQLFRIEYNTRSITPVLEKILNKLSENNSRAFGL